MAWSHGDGVELTLDDPLYAWQLDALPSLGRIKYSATVVFPPDPVRRKIVAEDALITTSRTAHWEWYAVSPGENLHIRARSLPQDDCVTESLACVDDAISEVYRLIFRSYIWEWPDTGALREHMEHDSVVRFLDVGTGLPDENFLSDASHEGRMERYQSLLSELYAVRGVASSGRGERKARPPASGPSPSWMKSIDIFMARIGHVLSVRELHQEIDILKEADISFVYHEYEYSDQFGCSPLYLEGYQGYWRMKVCVPIDVFERLDNLGRALCEGRIKEAISILPSEDTDGEGPVATVELHPIITPLMDWQSSGGREAEMLQKKEMRDLQMNSSGNAATRNKVFVVHGHDKGVRESVARFLEKLGFDAVILNERPDQGATIIEKFERESKGVCFAIVLLTPDDVGGRIGDDSQLRARQNVIFELGFFVGKLGRGRVALLRKGDVEMLSDYHGVVYREHDDHDGWKSWLAGEMKSAGLPIDLNKIL
ncbi:TIR domain-containing protein [Haliangium ochraceum]|nr:nucleotide-binding protein [Haliangium ochraceum]